MIVNRTHTRIDRGLLYCRIGYIFFFLNTIHIKGSNSSFLAKIIHGMEVVQDAWLKPTIFNQSFFSTATQKFGFWNVIWNNKLHLVAARRLIWILDVVQEYRNLDLSPTKVLLELCFLGLTTVEKLRTRQASRLTMIKVANANSKLFS